MVDVEPEHLAQQVFDVLGVIVRVIPRAAVAHPDIQEAVRTELDHASIVIGKGLRDDKEDGFLGVGGIGIGGGHLVFGHDGRAVRLARIVHEEPPVDCVIWMKGQTEKTPLSAKEHFPRDIEEVGRCGRSRLERLDPARLFDDEEPVGSVPSTDQVEWAGETREDRLELKSGCTRWKGSHDRRAAEEARKRDEGSPFEREPRTLRSR
jgi:hypothetical protein